MRSVEPAEGTYVARWNGEEIARSDRTVLVEGNHYFPPDDVRADVLVSSAHSSSCPWKGTASYHSISLAGGENRDAAWSYPEPKDPAMAIRGHIAFWRGVTVERAD